MEGRKEGRKGGREEGWIYDRSDGFSNYHNRTMNGTKLTS
jgi:hypothetical protein